MDLELDHRSLTILKQAFNWSDVDGDGLISREDLKCISGLTSDQEVDRLFDSLSGVKSSEFLTFEDFCRSLVNFPFLFERFKQECYSPKGAQHFFPSQPSKNANLLKAIQSLESAFGAIPRSPTPTLLAMLECLESLSQKLEKSTVSHAQLPHVKKALYYTAAFARDYIERSKDTKKRLKTENSNYRIHYNSLQDYCARLEESNAEMLKEIKQLEIHSLQVSEERTSALARNKQLQVQLKLNEMNDQQKLFSIQRDIKDKETAIASLNKELNKLNVLLSIQEVKSTDILPDEEIDLKKRRFTERMSLPKLKTPEEENPDSFSVSVLKQQLYLKNVENKELEDSLARVYDLYERIIKENARYKVENQKLFIRVKQERNIRKQRACAVELPTPRNPGRSLFEEFKQLNLQMSPDADTADSGRVFTKDASTSTSNKNRFCLFG